MTQYRVQWLALVLTELNLHGLLIGQLHTPIGCTTLHSHPRLTDH
jgi:hypothetical protein